MTTRCAFKIEDPSRGPGRADFTAPDEGFGLEGTPKPKIQRDLSTQKKKPYMWYAAVFHDSFALLPALQPSIGEKVQKCKTVVECSL